MSYKPASASALTNPFWTAYRSSVQVLASIPNDFSADTFINCSQSGSTGRVIASTPSFCIGELRVSSDGDYNLYDTGIEGGETIIAEGYQVRSNAAGTVLMDDACYGISRAQLAEIRIRALTKGSSTSADSNADELRLLGVRVK